MLAQIVLKIVFEATAGDFHLAQPQYRFSINSIVLCLNFAAGSIGLD